MRVQIFSDWGTFNLGIVLCWKDGFFMGVGPFLFRVLWGREVWRCDECGRRGAERVRK